MKSAMGFSLFLALLAMGSRADEMNPLSEVIILMDELAAKITKEGEAEAKAYADFVEWCDDFSRNKGFEIKTATARKEKLEAEIAKQTGNAEASAGKIDDLAASIAKDEAELKDATVIRKKEAGEFAANEAELLDVIDTLGRAISIIGREMAKNPAAFAQIDTSNIQSLVSAMSAIVDAAAFSSADKNKLVALVQSKQNSDADDGEIGAPAAAVYKTHSGNILDVLEDLKEKAEEQLSALRKAETNTAHNYDMLKQSLEDSIAADNHDLGEEKAAKAAAEEARASAEGDLAATNKDLADAEAALESANRDCMQVASDHEATVQGRAEELKAIADAKNLLTSKTGGAEGQTYSLLQLQSRADLANAEVVTMVKKLAQKHHSAALAQLASRISAVMRLGSSGGDDPFAKVKGLISEMISKLEAEADAEATEKAWCDEQIAKTEEKKTDLESDIAKLSANIDVAAAKSVNLKNQVKELQGELAALAKLQAEMNKNRQEGHAAFVQAKADLELGLQGVRQAIAILREYYGGAAALMQQPQPAKPELHAKAKGAGTSIIGILEVVESDFGKNLAKETTEEDDAEAEYQRTTQENKVTKTLKDQDVKYKTQEFTGLDKNIADMSGDRDTANSELSAVMDYYGKVKDRCIAKPETYEQRKARREAEIQGLKDALAILENETAFVQRGKKGVRAHFLAVRQ